MPPEAQAIEAKQPYADILSNVGKPTFSAVSDGPAIVPAKAQTAEPVDGGENKPKDSVTSDDKPEGEVDAQPNDASQVGGEDADKTAPKDRAVITRFKNQAKAAEQRASALETQVAQLADAVSKLTNPPAKEEARPLRASFDSPEDFEQALEDFAGRRAEQAARTKVETEFRQQDQVRKQEAILSAFNARKEAFEADHPDFDDVVYADEIKISPVMTQAILEADDGPAIAYHLAQNQDVAERIAGLTPAQAVLEIGKLSVKLANPPRAKPKPIAPLNVRNTAGPKDPSEMSMAEYAAYAKERDGRR